MSSIYPTRKPFHRRLLRPLHDESFSNACPLSAEANEVSACRLGQQHFDLPFDHTHGIGAKIGFSRRADGFSGADVELAAMQRTFDDVVVEPAVGQQSVSV